MMKILFSFLALLFQTALLAQTSTDEVKELEKFVGYYHVGVLPNKPLFYARTYIRNNQLCIIFDTDKDHVLNQRGKNFFYVSTDTAFQYPIEFLSEKEQVKGFKVSRPRDRWSTDLFGYKDAALSKYAEDTEKKLIHSVHSQHFSIYYGNENPDEIDSIKSTLESNFLSLSKSFHLDTVAVVDIRIYPDLATYHNSILTPDAPQWQSGRAWTATEIRITSPLVVKQDFGIAEFILHEYVHCLTWQFLSSNKQLPGWLWEGVAMYKGCCRQKEPKTIDYLISKKYPSLKEIENDRSSQLNYELGYYLVAYITDAYGWDKVLSLLKSNGTIKSSLDISAKEFEKRFYAYMENNYLKLKQ